MATTSTSICNSALVKIGAERITSLTDTDSVAAILCNEQFEKIRDEVLRAHPWNFALDRASLSQVADYEDPLDEWSYKYALPSTCLRVLRTGDNAEFKIEGRYLLSNESDVAILYIKKITDYSVYDPMALEALSLRIAVDLAYAITKSAPLAKSLMDSYRMILSEARSVDGQEGDGESHIITDFTYSRL